MNTVVLTGVAIVIASWALVLTAGIADRQSSTDVLLPTGVIAFVLGVLTTIAGLS